MESIDSYTQGVQPGARRQEARHPKIRIPSFCSDLRIFQKNYHFFSRFDRFFSFIPTSTVVVLRHSTPETCQKNSKIP